MAFKWDDLSPTQHAALLYKLEHPAASHREIAEEIGVSASAVSKWKLNDMVTAAMADHITPALDSIGNALMSAVGRLVEQLTDQDQRIAQGAAVKLLEYGLGKPKIITHNTNDNHADIVITTTRMDVEKLL